MRVGIITWYDIVNYGAVLQGYATQKVLESWGHESVFLRHKRTPTSNPGSNKPSFPLNVYSRLRDLTPNRIRNRRGYAEQREVFDQFRGRFLNIGDSYNHQKGLDAVVIGSDQIFDLTNGFNGFQYGKDIQTDRVIAYAPSFGETMIEDIERSEHKAEITILLTRMKQLSARDENTKRIIRTLTGKDIDVVLDSALLYGFSKEASEWDTMAPVSPPYLLVYMIMGVTTDRGYCDAVTRFARKHGLKTVSVGERRGWCDLSYPSASPQEFVQLIRQSKMVVTNTFHGTIFSMLFNKPFYVSYRSHNENKLFHLLNYFQLDSVIKNTPEGFLDADLPVIDFVRLNELLERRRQRSSEYLQTALNS